MDPRTSMCCLQKIIIQFPTSQHCSNGEEAFPQKKSISLGGIPTVPQLHALYTVNHRKSWEENVWNKTWAMKHQFKFLSTALLETMKMENKLWTIVIKPVKWATKSMAPKRRELYCLSLEWKCYQTSAKAKLLIREDGVPNVFHVTSS